MPGAIIHNQVFQAAAFQDAPRYGLKFGQQAVHRIDIGQLPDIQEAALAGLAHRDQQVRQPHGFDVMRRQVSRRGLARHLDQVFRLNQRMQHPLHRPSRHIQPVNQRIDTPRRQVVVVIVANQIHELQSEPLAVCALKRAAVELAKDWRTDRMLRRLEALLAVADRDASLIITGNGDVLDVPDGSGDSDADVSDGGVDATDADEADAVDDVTDAAQE